MSKSERELEHEITTVLAASDHSHEGAGPALSPRERLIVENLSSRAYDAMHAAEQRFGHSSPEHRVAWTVFSDAQTMLRGEPAPLAFASNAERSGALGLVEARCEDRSGIGTQGAAEEIVRIARDPRFRGWERPTAHEAEREFIGDPARGKRAASRATKQPRQRGVPRPYVARETKLVVPGRTGYDFTVVVRPAKVRTSYSSGGVQTTTVTLAERSDDQWLVMTKFGRYMGVLREGSGKEPWVVQKLRNETNHIGKEGVPVGGLLLSGATWQEAISEGVRAWWGP